MLFFLSERQKPDVSGISMYVAYEAGWNAGRYAVTCPVRSQIAILLETVTPFALMKTRSMLQAIS